MTGKWPKGWKMLRSKWNWIWKRRWRSWVSITRASHIHRTIYKHKQCVCLPTQFVVLSFFVRLSNRLTLIEKKKKTLIPVHNQTIRFHFYVLSIHFVRIFTIVFFSAAHYLEIDCHRNSCDFNKRGARKCLRSSWRRRRWRTHFESITNIDWRRL